MIKKELKKIDDLFLKNLAAANEGLMKDFLKGKSFIPPGGIPQIIRIIDNQAIKINQMIADPKHGKEITDFLAIKSSSLLAARQCLEEPKYLTMVMEAIIFVIAFDPILDDELFQ